MNKKSLFLVALAAVSVAFSGCSEKARQREQRAHKDREFTMGVVQKEVRVGMTEADVVTALGSPNMVTRDAEGRTTWVYDKIASEASESRSSGGFSLILFGFDKSAAASSSTQKTLTVIIKFNEQQQVETFTYHSSKF